MTRILNFITFQIWIAFMFIGAIIGFLTQNIMLGAKLVELFAFLGIGIGIGVNELTSSHDQITENRDYLKKGFYERRKGKI